MYIVIQHPTCFVHHPSHAPILQHCLQDPCYRSAIHGNTGITWEIENLKSGSESLVFLTNPAEILLYLIVQNHITWPPLLWRCTVGKSSLGIPGNMIKDDPGERLRVDTKWTKPMDSATVVTPSFWKWRNWIQRTCGSPKVPHEAFGDQKLSSGSLSYSIIAASGFLARWQWKPPVNAVGKEK